MAQSKIAGTFIPVNDSSNAGGSFYSLVPSSTCEINLMLNNGDSGSLTVNIAYIQGGVKNYQNYTVSSTAQVIPVPSNTSAIECNVQKGGTGTVTAIKIQLFLNS